MSDTLKQIADNLGVTTINGNYLSGIADYYGVDLATSTDLMADILTEVGGNPATSTDYLQDIVLELGGTVTINGNWMEAWEAITATAPVPVNTVLPALSFTFRYEGETVDTDDGTWNNSPTSFTYQWYRDATPISGETLSQYILTAADADTYVSCEVTAINGSGSSTPAPSDAIYIFDYDYGQVYYYYEDTAEAKSILQNQFMLAIKAAGVWAKLDVLCVFRGSGDGAALVDWKRLSEVTNIDCVFDTTQGFIGDASIPAYINTGFTPNTMGVNYTQNNASRYFFPYTFNGTGPMDGTQGGGGGSRNRMLLEDSIDHKINQNGAIPLSSTFEYTTTVEPKSIHRTSATAVKLYNDTTFENRVGLSDTVPVSQYILRNINDYADHTVAAYAMGASMVSENTDFVAAWNTYITAL
jgi:hypothetical protein